MQNLVKKFWGRLLYLYANWSRPEVIKVSLYSCLIIAEILSGCFNSGDFVALLTSCEYCSFVIKQAVIFLLFFVAYMSELVFLLLVWTQIRITALTSRLRWKLRIDKIWEIYDQHKVIERRAVSTNKLSYMTKLQLKVCFVIIRNFQSSNMPKFNWK